MSLGSNLAAHDHCSQISVGRLSRSTWQLPGRAGRQAGNDDQSPLWCHGWRSPSNAASWRAWRGPEIMATRFHPRVFCASRAPGCPLADGSSFLCVEFVTAGLDQPRIW